MKKKIKKNSCESVEIYYKNILFDSAYRISHFRLRLLFVVEGNHLSLFRFIDHPSNALTWTNKWRTHKNETFTHRKKKKWKTEKTQKRNSLLERSKYKNGRERDEKWNEKKKKRNIEKKTENVFPRWIDMSISVRSQWHIYRSIVPSLLIKYAYFFLRIFIFLFFLFLVSFYFPQYFLYISSPPFLNMISTDSRQCCRYSIHDTYFDHQICWQSAQVCIISFFIPFLLFFFCVDYIVICARHFSLLFFKCKFVYTIYLAAYMVQSGEERIKKKQIKRFFLTKRKILDRMSKEYKFIFFFALLFNGGSTGRNKYRIEKGDLTIWKCSMIWRLNWYQFVAREKKTTTKKKYKKKLLHIMFYYIVFFFVHITSFCIMKIDALSWRCGWISSIGQWANNS